MTRDAALHLALVYDARAAEATAQHYDSIARAYAFAAADYRTQAEQAEPMRAEPVTADELQ